MVCKNRHDIEECPKFPKMTLPDRKNLMKDKGLCWGCLRWGHRSKECRKKVCITCNGFHPSSLHDDTRDSKDKGHEGIIDKMSKVAPQQESSGTDLAP